MEIVIQHVALMVMVNLCSMDLAHQSQQKPLQRASHRLLPVSMQTGQENDVLGSNTADMTVLAMAITMRNRQ